MALGRMRLLLMCVTVGLSVRGAGAVAFRADVQDTVVLETRDTFDPRRVLEILYVSRPDSALALLDAQRAADTEDPFVLLLKAKVMRERLNDEDNNKELVRRSTEAIHAVIDTAIALSNEALDRDPKDYRQYYYRGYGWLSKAQLHVLTRSYWSAGRTAGRGKGDLERYLDHYPDDADAQGILGAYFYFADAIPGFVKFLAKLLLIPGGDREKGLDMMRYAATHDGVFSTDWRFALAAIELVFEGNFESGARGLIRLLEEYPYYTRLAEPIAVAAPLFPGRTAELREIAGEAINAHLTLDRDHVDWDLVKRLRLVNAFSDSYFGHPRRAIDEYTALIDAPPDHPDWVVPIARLNRGYFLMKTGDVDQARKDFDAVRTNARSTYYHRAAEVMLDAAGKPVRTIDLADLGFVAAIYAGRYDEAARGLKDYESKHGDDALSDFYGGDLAALRGDFAAAQREYEQALTREPPGGDDVFQMLSAARLAEIAGASGRYEEARNHLKRARDYQFVNYLLHFLVESRERYYDLLDHGAIDAHPALFGPAASD